MAENHRLTRKPPPRGDGALLAFRLYLPDRLKLRRFGPCGLAWHLPCVRLKFARSTEDPRRGQNAKPKNLDNSGPMFVGYTVCTCPNRSRGVSGLRGATSGVRVWLLRLLSLCMRTLRLLWTKLVRGRNLYWRRAVGPWQVGPWLLWPWGILWGTRQLRTRAGLFRTRRISRWVRQWLCRRLR